MDPASPPSIGGFQMYAEALLCRSAFYSKPPVIERGRTLRPATMRRCDDAAGRF